MREKLVKIREKIGKRLKDSKGFTLVEIVVVLVIIAILSTMLIGALSGYIDKANEKKLIANTRSVVVAAQTIITEKYGADEEILGSQISATSNKDLYDEIIQLSGISMDESTEEIMIYRDGNKVTYVSYADNSLEKVGVYELTSDMGAVLRVFESGSEPGAPDDVE